MITKQTRLEINLYNVPVLYSRSERGELRKENDEFIDRVTKEWISETYCNHDSLQQNGKFINVFWDRVEIDGSIVGGQAKLKMVSALSSQDGRAWLLADVHNLSYEIIEEICEGGDNYLSPVVMFEKCQIHSLLLKNHSSLAQLPSIQSAMTKEPTNARN